MAKISGRPGAWPAAPKAHPNRTTPATRPIPPLVALEDIDGIVFWREDEIAAFTPEFQGRLRGVKRDGSVAHLTGPVPAGPWVALGESWVLPQWLTQLPDNSWQDPAGFIHLPQFLPQPDPFPLPPPVTGLECGRDQVIGLQATGKNQCLWLTDQGNIPWEMSLKEAARRLPERVRVQAGLYLNRTRLGRIVAESKEYPVCRPAP
ncbi:hypothetical protein IV102_22480 [bacterium]|nr:hypothetical protein [bacterium]